MVLRLTLFRGLGDWEIPVFKILLGTFVQGVPFHEQVKNFPYLTFKIADFNFHLIDIAP